MSSEVRSLELNHFQDTEGELDPQYDGNNPVVGANGNDNKNEEVKRIKSNSILAQIILSSSPHVFASTYICIFLKNVLQIHKRKFL